MSISTHVVNLYAISHRLILKLAGRLDQQQLDWQPAGSSHSIAYEVWHIARWADNLQAELPVITVEMPQWLSPREEIWRKEQLAQAWGFPEPGMLGHDETGTYMSDDIAAQLPLPSKDILLDYARRAFSACEQAVEQIPIDQYLAPLVESPTSVVIDVLLTYAYHEGRHLGMIESLLGMQGEPGTATA